ncbi:MAG: hydantoinase B/oxoprolinase family protein, partial [Gammaproteobacteria bacterium]|nr:hydantoinase B/oxoprolinase family protein [Gammaproteobacteria bacterium]
GHGIVREYQFLQPTTVTLLTERRHHRPWGAFGAEGGKSGCNELNGQPLGAKQTLQALPGDVLTIATPGGGGWGRT